LSLNTPLDFKTVGHHHHAFNKLLSNPALLGREQLFLECCRVPHAYYRLWLADIGIKLDHSITTILHHMWR